MALKLSCGVILCLNKPFLKRNFRCFKMGQCSFLQFTNFNDGVATCTPECERENCASLHTLQHFYKAKS